MYFLFIMQTWNMMNTVNVITNFMIMIYVEHIVVYILFHFLKLKKIDNSPSAIVIYWVQY